MATAADVTQVSVEVAKAPATQTADVTQVSAEVIQNQGTNPNLDVTQVSAEVLMNQNPLVIPISHPMMLVDTLTHRGPTPWSTFSAFPKNVDGSEPGIMTVKEVQFVDPANGQEALGTLISFTNAKVYQMWGGTQDGTVFATATTWPLPDLSQLPFELRDTMKVFREIWVEGQDISNFQISWSIDGKPLSDSTKYFYPPRPLQNRTQIGANGRQIVLRFTHAAPSDTVPLLSYMKLDYDIQAKAAGSQGAGANY